MTFFPVFLDVFRLNLMTYVFVQITLEVFGIKPALKSDDYQPFNQRRYQVNTGNDSFLFSDMIRYNLIMNVAALIKNVVADPTASLHGTARGHVGFF
jgi:hypothetical protein